MTRGQTFLYSVYDFYTGELEFKGFREEVAQYMGVNTSSVYNMTLTDRRVKKRWRVKREVSKDARVNAAVRYARIIESYKQGLSINEIAAKHTYTQTRVKEILKECKLIDYSLEDELKEIDLGKVKALHNAHWSVSDIAHEFFTSESIIEEALKKI